jgi:putative ABC transport system permease protein
VRALDRKLVRDLWRLRGQVATIALVLAVGVTAMLALTGNYRALERSRAAYYERQGFPDAFVQLERAPEAIAGRLAALPGVASVETRLVEPVRFRIEGLRQPAAGRAVSLPGGATPSLRGLVLRRGRAPDPARADEVLVLTRFADAHRLEPGDTLEAILGGRGTRLHVAGVVSSPEWIFTMEAGFAGDKQFGVVWLPAPALAAAVGKVGAFNDATFRLAPAADEAAVIAAIDRLLVPYGGRGAHGRDRQPSHRLVTGELEQLRLLGTQIPVVFLLVAAFLLYVVLGRMIRLQREQLAVLRALGYPRRAIAGHVLRFAGVIVLLGSVLGIALGRVLGDAMVELYGRFFDFPVLELGLEPDLILVAVGVCAAAALGGALLVARRAARLAPAEAMRPPAPARYRRGPLSRLGLPRLAGPLGRMIIRELERRPVAAAVSLVGIAFAVAVIVLGRFSLDAMDYLIDTQFGRAMREDVAVILTKPAPRRDLGWFRHAPGVIGAEPVREVPARLSAGSRHYDTAVTGLPREGRLRRVLDRRGEVVRIPEEGLLLGALLAERLGVRPGDRLRVERRDGDHATIELPVAGLVDDLMGMNAYLELDALCRALGEEPTLSTVVLAVEPGMREPLYRALARVPTIGMVVETSGMRDAFEGQSGDLIVVYTLIVMAFGCVIAVGVVYNNARVALSERGRDLATLRVLGYTRSEVAIVVLGQLALEVAVAVPIGMLLGHAMAAGLLGAVAPEDFRLPVIISAHTYAFAALVVIGAALVTALVVRRRLDAIDLVGALKARD